MLVRSPTGVTCKGVLQLEATFTDVKNMYFHGARLFKRVAFAKY